MANTVYQFSGIVLLLGVALVLASVGALVWSGSIRDRELAEKLAMSDASLARAKAETQMAKANLAKTNERLAESEKEGAEAKFEETKLKGTAIWREVTPAQRNLFVAFAKDFPKGPVLIEALASNPEAANYARQLSDMLKDTGYTVEEKYGATTAPTPPPVGIQIKIRSMNAQPTYAGSLQKALDYIDIPTMGGLDNQAEDGVLIYVGAAP